jgi:DNA-directed RNA polymerase specialized sigma24 family protein
MPARVSRTPLDASAFARLLAGLHPDPAAAAVEYEGLRRTLVRFFDWRGVFTADAAADDTLDRLARRLVDGEPVADLRAYALGIARLVALEHHRRPDARHEPLDERARQFAAPVAAGPEPPRLMCFDRCSGELAADARELIVTYYVESGRARIDARARLARELALTPNALRLRAQRIRDRLESCIRDCLGELGA